MQSDKVPKKRQHFLFKIISSEYVADIGRIFCFTRYFEMLKLPFFNTDNAA